MKTIFFLFLLLFNSLTIFAQTVEIEQFANGFTSPTDIRNTGDERLFIVEQPGVIKILNADGSTNATPFLDITSHVGDSGYEQGLLGLAFHPDYATNGYFFVYYTNNSGNTQVSRFSVDDTNPDIANPDSELFIFDVNQPFSNHNGGCISFGSDGYLYIGLGDGGAAGDPGNRAQNLLNYLGKMLRIDIDNTENGNNYAIPADNPFVGNPDALDEIWAYGLRNPWRFSFDTVTNNLWIADVGQNAWEEVNRETATIAGLNYGWRCYEGNATYNSSGCPEDFELTFPIATYSHAGGNCSITGGYVYRGSVYSDIEGLYFFADVCTGMIGTIDFLGNMIDHGNYSGSWTTFGENSTKEMFIASISGEIYKIKGGVLTTSSHQLDSFSMFPNPASDSLQVTLDQNTIKDIEILSLKGSTVFIEQDVNISDINLPISKLNSGIYLVRVTTNDGKTLLKKLIVD